MIITSQQQLELEGMAKPKRDFGRGTVWKVRIRKQELEIRKSGVEIIFFDEKGRDGKMDKLRQLIQSGQQSSLLQLALHPVHQIPKLKHLPLQLLYPPPIPVLHHQFLPQALPRPHPPFAPLAFPSQHGVTLLHQLRNRYYFLLLIDLSMRHHLMQQSLLVQVPDRINNLALGMLAVGDKIPKEKTHNQNYSRTNQSSMYTSLPKNRRQININLNFSLFSVHCPNPSFCLLLPPPPPSSSTLPPLLVISNQSLYIPTDVPLSPPRTENIRHFLVQQHELVLYHPRVQLPPRLSFSSRFLQGLRRVNRRAQSLAVNRLRLQQGVAGKPSIGKFQWEIEVISFQFSDLHFQLDAHFLVAFGADDGRWGHRGLLWVYFEGNAALGKLVFDKYDLCSFAILFAECVCDGFCLFDGGGD